MTRYFFGKFFGRCFSLGIGGTLSRNILGECFIVGVEIYLFAFKVGGGI